MAVGYGEALKEIPTLGRIMEMNSELLALMLRRNVTITAI